MPIYNAPTRDMKFLIHDVLNSSSLQSHKKFEDVDMDLMDAILEEGAKFSSEVLVPLNVVGDKVGCKRNADGSVDAPPGFKEAFEQFTENGWTAIGMNPEYGGQALPGPMVVAITEMMCAANNAFATYGGLTTGAIKAIDIGATQDIKDTYLPKMVSCEWTGTMNLTEPHCGTDLGLLKTKAVPNADGSYKISGQKIFITGGEHELSKNIIHLVLARVEGAPKGVKGLSLFIVPKFKLDADGIPGTRNTVSCGSIEEKMGLHGSPTCVMNYDAAEGYLIGKENQGLSIMFVMMNRARLDVGMQGVALSEAAYQNAADYANDRLQGRSVTGPKNETGPADPIIVHPDVRRMLLETKAFNESSRALIYWASLLEDMEELSESEEQRQAANDLLGLLTPVIKGYLSDKAIKTTIDCQQIFGGHGYIEEWGMSQFVRDVRIAAIYEGANGVQALDLVGRKLGLNGGRAIQTLFREISDFSSSHSNNKQAEDFIKPLQNACLVLKDATQWISENGSEDPNEAISGSFDYMEMMGLVSLAYMWAKMAVVAQSQIDNGSNDEFYSNKIVTGHYFMQRMLPMIQAHLARIKTGAKPIMTLKASAF